MIKIDPKTYMNLLQSTVMTKYDGTLTDEDMYISAMTLLTGDFST